jgi:large subunit ribosomal protein L43
VKNQEIKQIYKVMDMLKNSSGRKITRLNRPVETQTPSIQGIWTPMLNLQNLPDFDVKIVPQSEDMQLEASST